ncbi:MAG: prolyl oligopeptidase family serine peptidase [Anaerolineae bacterium]|nr:prolyl oligopeptidase family serine peptidase [Anaerolineae bacterium]
MVTRQTFISSSGDELIPWVEDAYRADPTRRILAGHSYGGLFALFSLFTTPDLFNYLIAGSPTLSYGDRFMFQQERAFAAEHRNLPATVLLFAAEQEEFVDDTTLTDTLRLTAILESRHYESFSLIKRIFLGENHCEVAAPGFHWGLKHALRSQIHDANK